MTAYEENPALKAFFSVLSLSLDKGGLPYISTVEARDYPITATQWHPEKNQFGARAARCLLHCGLRRLEGRALLACRWPMYTLFSAT